MKGGQSTDDWIPEGMQQAECSQTSSQIGLGQMAECLDPLRILTSWVRTSVVACRVLCLNVTCFFVCFVFSR